MDPPSQEGETYQIRPVNQWEANLRELQVRKTTLTRVGLKVFNCFRHYFHHSPAGDIHFLKWKYKYDKWYTFALELKFSEAYIGPQWGKQAVRSPAGAGATLWGAAGGKGDFVSSAVCWKAELPKRKTSNFQKFASKHTSLPFSKINTVCQKPFASKLLLDAMNGPHLATGFSSIKNNAGTSRLLNR